MTQLTEKETRKIAHLARLDITDAEIAAHTKNLSDILNFVDQINEIDTAAIEPMAHAQEIEQRLRPDEVTTVNEREEFQKIAPQTSSGLYLVPKVIESCEIS